MDNEQTKFWAVLIGILVAVAVAVTVIDLTIKAAILEESNAFKRQMNGVKHGTGPGTDQTNTNGIDNHSDNDTGDDSDNVRPFPARLEAPVFRSRRARTTSPGPMAGTIEHSERNGNGTVEDDDKPVDA